MHYELYWDGFNQTQQRNNKGTGVYLRFAGDKKVCNGGYYCVLFFV